LKQDPKAAHTLFNRLQTIQAGYRTRDSGTGATNTDVNSQTLNKNSQRQG